MKLSDDNDKCVIIVAYNEENSILSVLEQVFENFEGSIIIVNDGSTDKTPKIVQEFSKNHNRIFLLNHIINIGPFVAVHTAVQFGISLGCKFFINVDGDGQHPPKFIPKLLEPILKNEVDLVIGSRYMENSNYQTSFTRSFGIKGSSKALSIFGGTKIFDVASGYRAYNLKCAKMILSTYLEINTVFEFTLRFCKKGYMIKEIPISMEQRQYGSSYLTYWKLFLYPFRIFFEIIKSLI